MWLAPVIILGIVLCIVGFATGVGYLAIPALLVTILLVIGHFTVFRDSGDGAGQLENGAGQEGAGKPEDTQGGPLDESTGYAHSGQRVMTPEQAERHSAD